MPTPEPASASLLRELFSGLGSPDAPRERLVLVAWIHLVAFVPLVYVPVALEGARQLSRGVDLSAPLWVWPPVAGAVIAVNVVAVAWRGAPLPVLRALTVASLAGNIACNLLSTYPIGILTSAAAFYLVMMIAFYRVGVDHRMGAWTTVLSIVGLVGGVAVELSGRVPVHPAIPEARLPYYDVDISPLPVLGPSVVAMVALFALTNYAMNQSFKLHRYITESVLRRYLAPSLVARAARGEVFLDAPPARQTVTVVFADLVGFTSMSEDLEPEVLARVVNGFLTRVAELAHAHGATVDKFIGDCAMLVLGAPDPLPEEAQVRQAVRMARAIVAAIDDPVEGVRLQARVGIHTGEATVGNFGSAIRSDYTAIGPTVNIAARLEAAGEPGRVLVSEHTARWLDPAEHEVLRVYNLKGVGAPVRACFLT